MAPVGLRPGFPLPPVGCADRRRPWFPRRRPIRLPAACVKRHGGRVMPKARVGFEAPDFCLEDVRGRTVRLSDYRGRQHVVLVLNEGFG
jgi:hypothetical protein